MKKKELEEVLKVVEKETVRARSLGGYSTEAESLLVMWEVILRLTRHMLDEIDDYYPEIGAAPTQQKGRNLKKGGGVAKKL